MVKEKKSVSLVRRRVVEGENWDLEKEIACRGAIERESERKEKGFVTVDPPFARFVLESSG
jgi:hypothetical protein